MASGSARGSGTFEGSVLGPYVLERLLGEGGMGSVYEARQSEPVERRVAVKLMRSGLGSRTALARFEAERQALALMDHPSIARVFDGGTTDAGVPYLVMEFVEGLPITEYCDAHRLGVGDRVRLLRRVCEAVQHAHQKGVIHRDLKPSNVLVSHVDGRPLPKVIDFGLVKAVGTELTQKTLVTEQNEFMGTPVYMSPEQASGNSFDVDTRSDVYSLGVLLYELIVGSPPFENELLIREGVLGMRRLIVETEPQRPSRRVSSLGEQVTEIARDRSTTPSVLARSLRGDLDWVVTKCLEKDRVRRYETAAALASDLEAYVENRPVAAGPPSRSYRVRKAIRRHRVAFAGAVAVVVALGLGITGTTVAMLRARDEARRADRQSEVATKEKARAEAEATASRASERRAREAEAAARDAERAARDAQREAELAREEEADARRDAEREAKIAAEVNRFLEDDLLASADPNHSKARDVLVSDVVVTASRALGRRFADEPVIEASIRHTLGRTYLSLYRVEEARAELERAVERYASALGPDHPRTLDARASLALCDYWEGEYAAAEENWKRLLADIERTLGVDSDVGTIATGHLGYLYLRQARLEEAEPLLFECERLAEARFGPDDLRTVDAMANVAQYYQWARRLDDAEAKYVETLERARSALGEDHPQTLLVLTNLASVCNQRARFDEAREYLEEAAAGQTRILGRDHGLTLDALNNLAFAYQKLGRLDDAEPLFREVLATRRRVLGEDHPKTLTSMSNLGNLLRVRGALDEAGPLLTAALDGSLRVQGEQHPDTLYCLQDLSNFHAARERFDLAAEVQGEIVRILREASPPDPAKIDRILQIRFDSLRRAGDVEGAESVLLERYALHAGDEGAAGRSSGGAARRVRRDIIAFYRAHGRPEEAAKWEAGDGD